MKIIALEEHFVTRSVQAALERLPAAQRDPMASGFTSPEMEQRLHDLSDRRLADMDAMGVDVQVLSLTSPGVQPLDDEDAISLARDANDLAAATAERHPERLQWFATLPIGAPDAAVEELGRAVANGAQGAMVFGRTRDRHLDHPDNAPILAEAARLRAPLYLHPQTPPVAVRAAYYDGLDEKVGLQLATAGIGWHYETGLELIRLILSGTFDRFPDLQVIVGHWGEVVLFYLGRMELLSQAAKLDRPLIDYVRQNVFVTPSGIASQRYLRWAIEVIGVERILFSTDYPYVIAPDGGSRRFLEKAELADDDRSAIAHGNWDRLTQAIRRTSHSSKPRP